MICEKYYEETPKEYISLTIKSLEQNRLNDNNIY